MKVLLSHPKLKYIYTPFKAITYENLSYTIQLFRENGKIVAMTLFAMPLPNTDRPWEG